MKLAYEVLLLNVFVVALCYYVRQKVYDREWVFIDEYSLSQDWSGGLANLVISAYNLSVVFVFFTISQVLFWNLFRKANKLMRRRQEKYQAFKTIAN